MTQSAPERCSSTSGKPPLPPTPHQPTSPPPLPPVVCRRKGERVILISCHGLFARQSAVIEGVHVDDLLRFNQDGRGGLVFEPALALEWNPQLVHHGAAERPLQRDRKKTECASVRCAGMVSLRPLFSFQLLFCLVKHCWSKGCWVRRSGGTTRTTGWRLHVRTRVQRVRAGRGRVKESLWCRWSVTSKVVSSKPVATYRTFTSNSGRHKHPKGRFGSDHLRLSWHSWMSAHTAMNYFHTYDESPVKRQDTSEPDWIGFRLSFKRDLLQIYTLTYSTCVDTSTQWSIDCVKWYSNTGLVLHCFHQMSLNVTCWWKTPRRPWSHWKRPRVSVCQKNTTNRFDWQFIN